MRIHKQHSSNLLTAFLQSSLIIFHASRRECLFCSCVSIDHSNSRFNAVIELKAAVYRSADEDPILGFCEIVSQHTAKRCWRVCDEYMLGINWGMGFEDIVQMNCCGGW